MGIGAEGQVGPRYMSDGGNTEWRQERTGGLVVTQAHGAMGEAAQRGKLFSGMTAPGGTTIVAANVSPVGAAAASILSLYNPVGSGVLAVVHRLIIQNISGTPGATAMTLDAAFNQVITATPNNGGTAGAYPANHMAGGNSGTCIAYTQTNLTGAAAQTYFRLLGHVAFATALAATTPNMVKIELLEGEIALGPGSIISLSAGATGTSHIVAASFTWEEVPL